MQFVPSLKTGFLVKRYKRFLSDIRLDNSSVITAHCPNTGPLTGLLFPDSLVAFSENQKKGRLLNYTLEMIFSNNTWVGTNTHTPNRLVREAFENKRLPPLSEYSTLHSEVKIGESRLDFYATKTDNTEERGAYIEVKNVHWRRGNQACFPDTVTTRGKKHLHTLIELAKQGWRSMMIYVVQRQDCSCLTIAKDVDPAYALAYTQALSSGVEFFAYSCEISPQGITLGKSLPVQEPE